MSKSVDEENESQFHRDRVAQTHRRFNGYVKSRYVLLKDDAARWKGLHSRANARMNDRLGGNQYWQRDQQFHLGLNVIQERHFHRRRQQMRAERRQYQQWQPCNERNRQYSPMQ